MTYGRLCMFFTVRVRLRAEGGSQINFVILCVTSLGSFAVLFLVAKFMGHKQIAQLDFFDYITGITIPVSGGKSKG